MLILGIDPGLKITGYGLVELSAMGRVTLREAGVLRMKGRGDLAMRLRELEEAVSALVEETKPARMGVEQLYAHYKHPRTAILMGHARGVILLAAAKRDIPVTNLPSTAVKKSMTGNGHASKLQIQRSVQSMCGLKSMPEPPDVADAIAIAWTLAGHLSRGVRT